MAGGRRRGGFGGSKKRVKAAKKPFKPARTQRKNKGKRPAKAPKPSIEQLDRDIEQYWGGKVASEHLDRDMDEYWEKNKKPT